jgi:uncharacterized membrane protein YedE/YeeE
MAISLCRRLDVLRRSRLDGMRGVMAHLLTGMFAGSTRRRGACGLGGSVRGLFAPEGVAWLFATAGAVAGVLAEFVAGCAASAVPATRPVATSAAAKVFNMGILLVLSAPVLRLRRVSRRVLRLRR